MAEHADQSLYLSNSVVLGDEYARWDCRSHARFERGNGASRNAASFDPEEDPYGCRPAAHVPLP